MERIRTRSQVTGTPTSPRTVENKLVPRGIRHAVPATATLDVVKKVSGQIVEEKHEIEQTTVLVAEPLSDGAHGSVHVGGAITVSPQPYHSVSVRVGITMPCNATFEAADRMYESCSKWVDRKMAKEKSLALGTE